MSGGRRACDYDAMLVSLSLRSIARVRFRCLLAATCGEFNSGNIYATVRGVPATQPYSPSTLAPSASAAHDAGISMWVQ